MTFKGFAVGAALMLAFATVGGVSIKAGRAADTTLTFNKDVAPIIFNNCVSCHRPNQAAPMSLVSYKDVRPWARAIRQKVAAREMPPWYADPRFGTFRNHRALTQEQINSVVAWVDSGALEGTDPLPPIPQFADGWNHPSGRPPDMILEMPIEFNIPAEGQLPVFSIYSELPPELAKEDHFVEAIQMFPGNISAVHHSKFAIRNLPSGTKLGTGEAWPGGPVISNVAVPIDPTSKVKRANGIESVSESVAHQRAVAEAEVFETEATAHFIFYLPGNNGFAQFYPGVGKRIRHDRYIEWSVHYTPSGRPEKDRHRVGLWFQQVPATHEMLTRRIGDFHIVEGKDIVLPAGYRTTPGRAGDKSMLPVIPPNAGNWKITAITPFPDDVTLYLAYPHGHLRLTDMTYVLTYPDGQEETILSVPKYDFNWQLVYEWTQPIKVPAGSTIKNIGHYDNSAKNKWNPAPEKEVYWSEQTWDEMYNGFYDLSVDKIDVRLAKQPIRSTGSR